MNSKKERASLLEEILASISVDEIEATVGFSTFSKGQEYYNRGLVKRAEFDSSGSTLVALVLGERAYTVTIEVAGGELTSHCTCPIGGNCKHVVAALLFAVFERDKIEARIEHSKNNLVEQHLQSLSKSDLISLVLRFAPESYLVEVQNRNSGENRAAGIFRKAKKNIEELFDDRELLYEPDDFEAALSHRVSKIFGLERYLKDDIKDLILYIIRNIEAAIDEGLLYNDYYDDPFEVPEEFNQLISNLLETQTVSEKQSFFEALDDLISESSYDAFHQLLNLADSAYSESDLPELKQALLAGNSELSPALVEAYYRQVSSIMTWEEREIILSRLKEERNERLLELADLYRAQRLDAKAVDLLKTWLQTEKRFGTEEVYIYLIDLLHSLGRELAPTLKAAITSNGTVRMIQKIDEVTLGHTVDYELIMKGKSSYALLEFLEIKGRLSEALLLIKEVNGINDDRRFQFFKQHKAKFPQESEIFFRKWISSNLQLAGDVHYRHVAEGLKHLKTINRMLASELISNIKAEYKRRRNLMKLLDAL